MYFPITIIDNFLNNFNDVKNYVFKQNFQRKNKKEITMPGLATLPLNQLNSDYFNLSCLKILSIFFDRFKLANEMKYYCESFFEKIIPYGEGYDKQGWIHSDDTNVLSSILYFQGDFNEGTSFFKKKNIGYNYSSMWAKKDLYDGVKLDPKIYNEKLKEHNSQFDFILKVPLVENRLIIFDSSVFHCSDGYGDEKKPRIIQTSFFEIITGNINFPIPEMKRVNL